MYLSLLHLNPTAAAVQRDLRTPTDLHRTLMRAFPGVIDPEVKMRAYHGVLHRLEVDVARGQMLVYVQSRTVPDWSQLPPGYVLGDDGVRVKPVGDVYAGLKPGRVLRFRLRANPTMKIDTKSGPNGEKRNGRRVPVNGLDGQVEWLARKAGECGFELLQASIAASGSGELVKDHRSGKTFQGVVFEGRLVVRDPGAFVESLARGVGPGKAYGFGLLSVGPE